MDDIHRHLSKTVKTPKMNDPLNPSHSHEHDLWKNLYPRGQLLAAATLPASVGQYAVCTSATKQYF